MLVSGILSLSIIRLYQKLIIFVGTVAPDDICCCFKAPSYTFLLDLWYSKAGLMWEEGSLFPCAQLQRGHRYWEDSWGQVTVSVRGSCWDICAPALTLLLLSTTSFLLLLCWLRDLYLKDKFHSACSATRTGCVLTLAWRYWLAAFRSVSLHLVSSTSSCLRSMEQT